MAAVPEEKTARRRISPSKRGYAEISCKKEQKKDLAKAAKAGGYPTIIDYVMHLHREHQKARST